MDVVQTADANGQRQEKEAILLSLIEAHKFDTVYEECENWEFECAKHALSPDTMPFYSVQLLAYLIENETEHARFLWKRIPSVVKTNDPEVCAVWEIAKNVLSRNYTGIYNAINAFQWSLQTESLVRVLTEKFRQQTVELVGNAYSNIDVEDFATLTGTDPQSAIAVASQKGWEHEPDSNSLLPKHDVGAKVQKTGLDQLQQLTEYVVWLEQK